MLTRKTDFKDIKDTKDILRIPRMPPKKYINLDEYDSRVALYAEEQFQNGINFSAKVCIGLEEDSSMFENGF